MSNVKKLFPPAIVAKRLRISILKFYEDLSKFCKTMHWSYTPVIDNSKDDFHLFFANNMVTVRQMSVYEDSRPHGFTIEYRLPSFIGEPPNKHEASLVNIPEIGYSHLIYVSLPDNYPAVKSIEKTTEGKDHLYIESRSQLWHPRFYLRKESWGCIMVNGEMDRILMNLFQQLLWEPSHVWKSETETETTNNYKASRFKREVGKEPPHNILLRKMQDRFGVDE